MLRWLKRALTRNLLLKLTALVCAVVLWVYVDSSVEIERAVPVEVRVVSSPGWQACVVGDCDEPRNRTMTWVELTLRGPSRTIRAIAPGQIVGRVVVPGENHVAARVGVYGTKALLEPRHFCGTGLEAAIIRINPPQLSVTAVRENTQPDSQ